ncbi:hypothetical protein TNCV_3008201 [Trichonephila clavipes]|nr:hypothetical protein TNCV_3008201 [Trichonephila clavipes]
MYERLCFKQSYDLSRQQVVALPIYTPIALQIYLLVALTMCPLSKRMNKESKVQQSRLAGLEVVCPLRNSKVVGYILAGADRFSGCENRTHAHMSDDYVGCKMSLEYQFASDTLGKIKLQQYLSSDQSLN